MDRPTRASPSATIHRALETGCNFLDTAQLYGPMTNEQLVGRAIEALRTKHVIATKFARRTDGAIGDLSTLGPLDGSAEHVHSSVEGSLQRLKPTASTSTTSTASTRTSRSRRPSARWPSSSSRARSCTSASARRRPRRSAARTPCTRSPPCRSEHWLWTRDPAESEILLVCRERDRLRRPAARARLPLRPLQVARGARCQRLSPPRALHGREPHQNLGLAAKVEEIAGDKGIMSRAALAWLSRRARTSCRSA